jgi:fucose permease
MESLQVDSPQPEPQPPRLLLKLISAGFAFFVAGVNDGSLGSLIPYIREAYQIDTNMVAVVLVYFIYFIFSPGSKIRHRTGLH